MQNLTMLGFGYFLALYYDWRMALVVTGILPLMVVAQVQEGTAWIHTLIYIVIPRASRVCLVPEPSMT